MKITIPVEQLVRQPLLALFPHGLQHGARRNAYRAAGLAASSRRERQAVEDDLRRLARA